MAKSPETTTTKPQPVFAIAEVASPIPTARSVVESAPQPLSTSDRLSNLGTWIGKWLLRRYSAVRVVAKMKIAAFTLLLAFLGLGFTLKISALNVATAAAGAIEFILTSPDTVQSISATISFMFVVSANIYSRVRGQEDTKDMLKLAADPNTPVEVRTRILQTLQNE